MLHPEVFLVVWAVFPPSVSQPPSSSRSINRFTSVQPVAFRNLKSSGARSWTFYQTLLDCNALAGALLQPPARGKSRVCLFKPWPRTCQIYWARRVVVKTSFLVCAMLGSVSSCALSCQLFSCGPGKSASSGSSILGVLAAHMASDGRDKRPEDDFCLKVLCASTGHEALATGFTGFPRSLINLCWCPLKSIETIATFGSLQKGHGGYHCFMSDTTVQAV